MRVAISKISGRLGARAACAAVIACALAFGGCAADDIELNGKIFDAVGLNNKSKSAEPKLAARAPLVMPPSPDRVPEPGTPPEGLAMDVASLQDPDAKAKTSREELERQQAAYCKVHYEQAKSRGDDNADLAAGPLGPCRSSVLSAVKIFGPGSSEDDEE